ncbi:hypothetical protein BaRGS_00001346 [Batillaria attramentaria]|uniref:Uncharacterized protein n=1 Tax=Batillaria attramentaria TaxID=370345 RepID=A0ABD0M7I7_9CAEN
MDTGQRSVNVKATVSLNYHPQRTAFRNYIKLCQHLPPSENQDTTLLTIPIRAHAQSNEASRDTTLPVHMPAMFAEGATHREAVLVFVLSTSARCKFTDTRLENSMRLDLVPGYCHPQKKNL